MNNKFIRVLIVINGILFPLFILFLAFGIINETRSTHETFWTEEENTHPVQTFQIKYDPPAQLPYSENYYVAVRKIYDDEVDLMIQTKYPPTLPPNTCNILFMDKDVKVKGKIFQATAPSSACRFREILPNRERPAIFPT